eukprot:CAMPEP_0195306238 /NCGR_PEP_ID=MMETSP0707-20130614/37096_1 /TAXON_ID=33640 /ORGANISM="Asterionellopsis glacialis, Strain CCMP134" /LENGTH=911 /DNA_ID=CAMNT_0040370449 /DNA_START=494 /DNA_END=3229 /DNA_ORIENTATION=-
MTIAKEPSTTESSSSSSFESLVQKVKSYSPPNTDLQLLSKAYSYVIKQGILHHPRKHAPLLPSSPSSSSLSNKKSPQQHHQQQGPPTMEDDSLENSSLSIAHILADMKLDMASIVTGLLIHHDEEDLRAEKTTTHNNNNIKSAGSSFDPTTTTTTTRKQSQSQSQLLQDEFGPEVFKLVQGVTKIGKIQYESSSSSSSSSSSFSSLSNHHQAENHRKMIVAMAKDIRVILVKLADCTCTLRNLQQQQQQQEKKMNHARNMIAAIETLELYAPLAHRLGLYRIKTEMEDTSLQLWKPREYEQLKTNIRAKKQQRQIYTDNVISILKEQLQQGGMRIAPRSSSITSTARKHPLDETLSSSSSSSSSSLLSSSSIQVTGRAKSFYSIYQKMQSQQLEFKDIQDLMAFRIVVTDVAQCYLALGIVHSHWIPVQGRFKDYIASPKPNGYQSLHTTVMGPEGNRIEVQIRTHTMHHVAEGGIAAHWQYKQQSSSSSRSTSGSKTLKNSSAKGMVDDAKHFTWLRQLVDSVQQQSKSPHEVKDVSSVAALPQQENLIMFENEVFCFSPQGQLFALPQGSSVLDFAYRVHSDLGNHCVGAKVNGKMVSLKYTFQNGDTVEIIQNSNQNPQREWLDFCRTSKAKSRIKSWLTAQQRDESIALGKSLLEKELKKYGSSMPSSSSSSSRLEGTTTKELYREKLDRVLSTFSLRDEPHLLAALAYGQISVGNVMDEIFGKHSRTCDHTGLSRDEMGDKLVLQTIQEKSQAPMAKPSPKTDGIVVGGERNMLINFCGNCSPLLGEEVKGVITRGRGIKIHRLGCTYLQASDEERIVHASWDATAKTRPRSVQLDVIFEDAPGMLASMSGAIASAGVNIANVVLKKLSAGRGLARFSVMLPSVDELHKVLRQLQQEQGVLSVTRR